MQVALGGRDESQGSGEGCRVQVTVSDLIGVLVTCTPVGKQQVELGLPDFIQGLKG